MVQIEDRSAFAWRTRKTNRTYEKLPPERRLTLWMRRIAKTTAHYARPHRLEIRQSLATALDLPTRWVELRDDGTLWHESKPEPIAKLPETV